MKEYHKILQKAARPTELFMQKTFRNVVADGPPLSPRQMDTDPTMLVCTHRSHLDYVLLGMTFHKMGLNNLRFAAGDNLTLLPYAGKKFRSYGAFTVYRARSHRRSYIFELTQQVVQMLNNRDNIIVFPEGGRSYDGSMMAMKSGILAANILAQHRNPERRFVYLPVAISYERFPELFYFDILQHGRDLRAKKADMLTRIRGNMYYFGADLFAFMKFLTAHKFGIQYGDVFIDYGEPIAVNDIVDLKGNYAPHARNEFLAHKVSIQRAGEAIREQLLCLYRILPMHVVAAIVKETGPTTPLEIQHRIPDVVAALVKNKRNCKSLHALADRAILEKGIAQLAFAKAIIQNGKLIHPKKNKILHYYAASIT